MANAQQKPTIMGPMVNHLDTAIAILSPDALILVEYNEHFFKRCMNNLEPNQPTIKTTSVLKNLKQPLLQKVLNRNRVYRYQETFEQRGQEHPVDFIFSKIHIQDQCYILLQGTDNKNALETKNLLESYELIFQAQTLKIKEESEKFQAADKSKSIFLSRMSHELRTPLNAILGFGQIQAGHLAQSPALHENNQYILDAGNHLLELIEEMFDFVELQSNKKDLSITNCQIDHCLATAIDALANQAEHNDISIHYQTTGFTVKADEKRLIQICKSLLCNAIKFNISGGVVNIRAQEIASNQVQISFEDSGVGLHEKELQHLFEPFFRSAYAEKQQLPGIGMGLVLSQKLAIMMDGKLHAINNRQSSNENTQGMTFYLDLPLVQAASML